MMTPRDLEDCLREHGGGLHSLACALLGRGDADDAVQEVWLELLRSPPRRGGPLGGWLRTVLQHVAWQSRRGERRRVARETVVARDRGEVIADHVDVSAREECMHLLVAEVHALQPAFRDVLWQRFFEGLPPRAIAAATGVPVSTVKSRLLRGLEQLRERLGAQNASDWRAGLIGAFGLGAGSGTAAVPTMAATSWPGVLWMTANL